MSDWLAQTLLATALLMAVVLVLRPAVRRLFGAEAAYALWLVPALRLVLPSFDFAGPAIPTVTAVEIVRTVAPAAAPSATPWLLAIWATGAAGFALWHLVGYQLFLRRARRGAVAHGDGVLASAAVEGPAAVGLLTQCILVPLDFADRFSPAERALAIAHERTHHARGDLWANAAALGLLCLHWFNPLAWAAHRAFRSDQELSCDAAVIGRAGAEQRAVYAAAMVKSAWGRAPSFTCPMSRTGNLLRRLKMVKTHKTSRWAKAGGMMTVGAVALAGLTMTATGAIAADPEVKHVIVKRFKAPGAASDDAIAEIKARCGPEMTESLTKELSRLEGKPVKVKTLVCGDTSTLGSDRLAKLEKARAHIVTSADVKDVERGPILAALDAKIAELKAAR